MVNWKANDATDRLFGALIAAHPSLKHHIISSRLEANYRQLDYSGMAAMYGRGAIYDSVEGRFRNYRKIAEELKSEAAARGVTSVPRGSGRNGGSGASTPRTPRTPRGPRNGVTKSSASTPTGRGKQSLDAKKKSGKSILDAISLDGDGDSNTQANVVANSEAGIPTVTVSENGDIIFKSEAGFSSVTASETGELIIKKDQIIESIENVEKEQKPQLGKGLDSHGIKQEPRVDSRSNGYLDVPMAAVPGHTAAAVGASQDFDMSRMENVYFDNGYEDMGDIYSASA
ncbi:hypothetical protein M432DRAFT_593446 [Thermoascus aurantiacus ATCC 26904]